MRGTLSVMGLLLGLGLVSAAVAEIPAKSHGTKRAMGPGIESGLTLVTRKLKEMAERAYRPTVVVRVSPWRIIGDLPLAPSVLTRVAALGAVAPPMLTREEQRRIDFIELIEAIDHLKIDLAVPGSNRLK